MSYIKIENGVVKIMEENTLEAYSLKEFMEKLKEKTPIEGQFVPPGVVYTTTAKTGKQFIIKEFKPRNWSIQYESKEYKYCPPFRHPVEHDNTFSFRMSYPWTYLVLVTFNNRRLDQLSLFFTKEPLRSSDTTIFAPFVTNMWYSNRIRHFCMGDMKTNASNLEELVEQTADQYFMVKGNNDLDVCVPKEVCNEVDKRTSFLKVKSNGELSVGKVSDSIRHVTKSDYDLLRAFEVYEKMSQDDPEIGMKLKYVYSHNFGDWINGFVEQFQ